MKTHLGLPTNKANSSTHMISKEQHPFTRAQQRVLCLRCIIQASHFTIALMPKYLPCICGHSCRIKGYLVRVVNVIRLRDLGKRDRKEPDGSTCAAQKKLADHLDKSAEPYRCAVYIPRDQLWTCSQRRIEAGHPGGSQGDQKYRRRGKESSLNGRFQDIITHYQRAATRAKSFEQENSDGSGLEGSSYTRTVNNQYSTKV